MFAYISTSTLKKLLLLVGYTHLNCGWGRVQASGLCFTCSPRLSCPSLPCVPPQVFHVQNQTLPWGNQVARFHAGLHLVTLNERTGEVMRAETFFTWQPETSHHLAQALQDASEGRLLVLVGLVSRGEWCCKAPPRGHPSGNKLKPKNKCLMLFL